MLMSWNDKGPDYKIPYMDHTKTTHYCCWHFASLYVFIYHRIIIRSVMDVDAIATVLCGNMPTASSYLKRTVNQFCLFDWKIYCIPSWFINYVHYTGHYEQTDGNIYSIEFDDLYRLILDYKTYGLQSWFIIPPPNVWFTLSVRPSVCPSVCL